MFLRGNGQIKMAQGRQVLFVSICFYIKVRSGILSRSLRFQRKCAWSQDDVPWFFLTEELRKKPQLTWRVIVNLTQHKSTGQALPQREGLGKTSHLCMIEKQPCYPHDFILTSLQSSTGKQQAFTRKTMRRVMWWS